jgi:hypothetical protein
VMDSVAFLWAETRSNSVAPGSFNSEATPQMITSALGQLKAISRIAFYLLVAFLVIRLWQDPAGSADATVNFIGSIGSFFSDAIDKLSTFVRSLGD